MSRIAVGAPAPDFDLVTDSGEAFRLSDQKGHPVVLFFYPEDDTEGCTIENIEFTQLKPEFDALGVRLVGISPDSVEKHCAFRDKHGLTVPLAADPDHKAIGAFKVWQKKKLFGHEYDGLVRTTFLIDATGRIAGIWPVTRIKGHAAAALAGAKALPQAAATARR